MIKNMQKVHRFWEGVFLALMAVPLYAGIPVWTYSAPTPTQLNVSNGETATLQYTVTNQSHKAKHLILQATSGLSSSPCFLAEKGSTCVLTLTINGNQLPAEGLHAGPVFCEQSDLNQCYQPSQANSL